MRRLHDMLHLAHVLKIPERRDKRILDVGKKLYAEIHLEEREAHLHAILQGRAHVAPATLGVGVAVAANLVTPLSAEELPYWESPRLAAEIPACELDRAHATSLARVAAELLDAAENLLDVARVFAEDA